MENEFDLIFYHLKMVDDGLRKLEDVMEEIAGAWLYGEITDEERELLLDMI